MLEPARVESTRIYSASETAARLGVSVGMLRRYALAYEQLGGEIILDPQRGRQYTEAQVEALEQARSFIRANPGLSVEDAVRATLGGEPSITVKAPAPMPGELALREAVASSVRPVLTEALQPLLERLESQEVEIKALREQLQALPKPQEEAPAEAADQDLVADLKRRNAYLEGELKRRDAEVEKPRRGWWPWGRK